MNVLGLDTSTAASAAAVLRSDGQAFAREAAPAEAGGRPGHSAELMPRVVAALDEAGLAWAELDAVAVGVGPGAFTGLRIGVATARALSAAHGLELRPVSSLAALAAGIDADLRLPLIDAGRGEVFAALYEGDRQRWAPFATTAEALAERVRAEEITPLAAGNGSVRWARRPPGGRRASRPGRPAGPRAQRGGHLPAGARRGGRACGDRPAAVPARTRRPSTLSEPTEIRRLTYADLPQVIAIERRAFTTPWSLAMFVLELSKASGICLAATRGERLVAYLICSRYDTIWHVMNVAVDDRLRREGLATALLEHLLAEADAPGEQYTLEVRASNTDAIRLYEGFGFRDAGRRRGYYHDNREDAVIMWRTAEVAANGSDAPAAARAARA